MLKDNKMKIQKRHSMHSIEEGPSLFCEGIACNSAEGVLMSGENLSVV